MDNLQIISRQNDVTPFYNEASIVLNLSDKQRFVETFGLTALEAMSAGLPVIVPTEDFFNTFTLAPIIASPLVSTTVPFTDTFCAYTVVAVIKHKSKQHIYAKHLLKNKCLCTSIVLS